MWRHRWFRRLSDVRGRVPALRSRSFTPHLRGLRCEPLEERRLLTITVDTLVDELDGSIVDGDVSLRDAIAAATPGETINFDGSLDGGTITLSDALGELAITDSLVIDGPGAGLLTIDAGNGTDNTFDTGDGYRIFNIDDGDNDNEITVEISGLTLTGGDVGGPFPGDRGGAIFNSENLTLTGSTISGNAAFGGGAIFTRENLTLTGSTISGNTAYKGGGIIGYGAVTLTNSTVSGNSTAGLYAQGGGISSFGTVTLINSTVSGNSASGTFAEGGGIFSAGTITLTNSTVSGNSASGVTRNGGGIRNSFGSMEITNSIVAGNTAGGMPDIDPAGSGAIFVDYSLIGDTSGSGITGGTGSGNILDVDPMLGPLADNGGPTQTHALLSGSPAIDARAPGFLPPSLFDQRGSPFARVADGGVGGLWIDMGAYEWQTVAGLNLVVDTPIDENDGDYGVGDFSLREAVRLANGSVGTDTITFDPTVFATAQTILLGQGEIDISEAVTINGPGQQLLTIDAQHQSRIFAITATTGDFTIAGLTITGGTTTFQGGAIRSSTNQSLTIDQSTISGNSSAGGGGGISSHVLTLTNSTVSGNSTAGSSAHGGGISSVGVTLTNSTVSGNSTAGFAADGGGISNFTAPIVITNSIVAGNTAGGGMPDIDPGTGALNVDYSLIGDTSGSGITTGTGTGNILDVDPLLGPLADNGGPTRTHDLLPGSPVIDAGDPAFVPPPFADQRGYYRVAGGRVDMGAVEFGAVVPLAGDGNLDGVVDGLDYILWAAHFDDDPAMDPPGAPLNGDFNDDGVVDGLDYIVWAMNFGAGVPAAPSVSQVSEPAVVDAAVAIDYGESEYDKGEYDAGVALGDDRVVRDWQLGRAMDRVFARKRERGKF